MDNGEKFVFLADDLAGVLSRYYQEFAKLNKKSYDEMSRRGDVGWYSRFVSRAIIESADVINKWDKERFKEIGDITPEELFGGLEAYDEILAAVEQFIDRNGSIFPPSLEERVRKSAQSLKQEVVSSLTSITPDKNGKLNLQDKAVLKIVGIISMAEFADPLTRLLLSVGDGRADDDTVDYIMDAYREIGEPSIKCLIAVIEKSGRRGDVFAHSIMTLGEIGSKHRSEELFRYLKECFRKSASKLACAAALSYYGDRRASTMIRSYVERNLYDLEETVYSSYRDMILQFGGIVSDLDDEYVELHGDERE